MTTADNVTIETLRQRFENLNAKKITAEANRRHAENRLEELRKEAREQFGTDNLEELRQKLREMEAENRRLTEEYEQHLNEIEANLTEIESRYRGG